MSASPFDLLDWAVIEYACRFIGSLVPELRQQYNKEGAERMRCRAAAVENGHHLVIDGTLKSDESRVNSLSNFSRKARTKGSRDIPVIYAYDLETGEPVCSECFPGNMMDVTAYHRFIRDNGITSGIIVADKGFPAEAAASAFAENPDLHYLNPVNRNSKYIETHGLHHYERGVEGREGLLCKKAKVG